MWNFRLFPEQASSLAARYDFVFWYEVAIAIFFTIFVALITLVLAVHYRRGSKANRVHPPTHNSKLEAIWITVPFVISMSMFAVSAVVFIEHYTPPADAVQLDVVGKQWMWKIQHPSGKKEINELHVPVGQAVRLHMISQDVIHSFFVPAFRVKQDVLPGRYTELWFRPTQPGRYRLFCAEYCGTDHSAMGGYVEVMSPADYEQWLQSGTTGITQIEEGRKLFTQYHCAGCHNENATVRAPRLEGVYGKPVPIQNGEQVQFVKADDRYIRDSILLPKSQVVAGYQPLMPSFEGQINEEDLLKIIAYIKSLALKSEVVPGRVPEYDVDKDMPGARGSRAEYKADKGMKAGSDEGNKP